MPKKLSRRDFAKRSAATGAAAAGWLSGCSGEMKPPRELAARPPSVAVERTDTRSEQAAAEGWGDLVGRFVYDGDPPQRKKLKVDKDVDCCGKFDIRDESLMVGPEHGLANVYVYLRSRRVDVCPELEASAEDEVLLDNRDCIFIPHCMKIWCRKQVFRIVNSDPVAQNIAFSPLGDLPANIVLPPPPDKAAEATWKFRRAQRIPVPIACNYHPWESAYILPLDHPYCAISQEDGRFRIPKLPAGEWEFQLWQERVGYLETPDWPKGRLSVTIAPGENDLGTVKLNPALFAKAGG